MYKIEYLPASVKDTLEDSMEYVPSKIEREVVPNEYAGGHYALYKNKLNGKFYILLFAQEYTKPEADSMVYYATQNNYDLCCGDFVGLI